MTNVEHLATELINPEIAVRKVLKIMLNKSKERKTIERVESVKRSRPVVVGTMISDEYNQNNGFVVNKH
jgi:hypothetical protein